MTVARLFPIVFVLCCPLAGQTPDSQTLQALLQEVRQLRDDVQGMTLVGQRVQILLYRIHLQSDVVKKYAESYEQAKAKLKEAERARAQVSLELKTTEERLADLQDRTQRTGLENHVREMKRRIEMWSQDEGQYRGLEADAANDLRREQVKLTEFQDRIDKLEKQLEGIYNARPAR